MGQPGSFSQMLHQHVLEVISMGNGFVINLSKI